MMTSLSCFVNLLCVFLLLLSRESLSYLSETMGRTHKETACDGYEMKVLCPASYLISVRAASYGRQDDRTCIVEEHRMTDTHCSLDGALQTIANKCNGRSECAFTVEQPLLVDPCPGTSKYLNVMWKCVLALTTCSGKLANITRGSTYVTTKETNGAWVRDPLQHSQKYCNEYFTVYPSEPRESIKGVWSHKAAISYVILSIGGLNLRIYHMRWSKYESPTLYEYSTTQQLVSGPPSTFHPLPHRVDGTGFAVYDGCLFYNVERSRTVAKYDLGKEKVVARMDLDNANYHGTSPYAVGMNTDIDLAVDENGLWVIYATEANKGNIVMTRLQHQTLNVLNTWYTTYEKLSALNAFVVCGVLYVVSFERLQIEYMYNSTSLVERRIEIPIPGLNRSTSAIDYNPQDHMLYVWDNGVATLYSVQFDSQGTFSLNGVVPPNGTSHATISPTMSETNKTISKPVDANKDKQDNPEAPPSRPNDPVGFRKFCPDLKRNGLNWPKTTFSKTATLDCPGTKKGQAIWTCGGSADRPQWTPSGPNLSQCTSTWVNAMKHTMGKDKQSAALVCRSLLRNLYDFSGKLTSWDLVEIVEILRGSITSSSTHTSSASDIADSVLKITSELLRPAMIETWKDLGKEIQTETATSLVSVLEEAAFFLAKDMTSSEANNPSEGNKMTWSQHYATLAIRVEPVPEPRPDMGPTPRVTLRSGHGDVVVVDDVAIVESLGAKPGDKVVTVHLSLKTLGHYLVDGSGYGSPWYPVNSQVVSLSARSMNSIGDWSPTPGTSLNLRRPISIHLHHNKHRFKQHVCAFWNKAPGAHSDDGSWSRAGCTRVSGNSSYSVCQCDHLTNFVVLSSNHHFPLMGAKEAEPEMRSMGFIAFINIIRGGMIVSLVFHMMALSALLLAKKRSDTASVRKNLLISLILTQLIFLAGFTQSSRSELCTFVAVSLHFGVLTTFTWAALMAVQLFLSQRDVDERSTRWKYYYAVGYCTPALVVGASLAADLSAFQNQSVCWVRMSDSFIWFFIAPCLLAVLTALGLIIAGLWKLSRDKTRTGEEFANYVRPEIATTCVIMFLICAEWASSFMWISGFLPNLTAWLFSIFSCLCGIAPFVFFCVLPPEVSLCCGCSGRCRMKQDAPRPDYLPYPLSPPPPHHPSSTLQAILRGDVATTTLLPSNDLHSLPYLKSTASAGKAHHPLCDARLGLASERITSNPRRSSLIYVDVTDPKLPVDEHSLCIRPSWNDYVRGKSGHDSNTIPRLVDRSCRSDECPQCPNGYGVTPFCSCTTSTCNSCCYDHLHEESSKRNMCHRNLLVSNKCNLQRRHDPGSQQRYSSHLYETLESFRDHYDPMQGGAVQGYSLRNRHRYEDVEITNSQAPCNHPNALNRTGSRAASHIHSTHVDNQFQRNGRSSDPLSTDQGYDTDCQQPPLLSNHHSNCEEGSHRGSLQFATVLSTVQSISEERRQSASAASESVSENDREVELINSSSSRKCSEMKALVNACNNSPVSSSPFVLHGSRNSDPVLTTSLKIKCPSAFDPTAHGSIAVPDSRLNVESFPNNRKNVDHSLTLYSHFNPTQASPNYRRSVDSHRKLRLDEKPTHTGTLPCTTAIDPKRHSISAIIGNHKTTNL